ncbi:TspO/MBR family protein [Peribacillus sp. SCS-37]|uniref:TspO/MBR family protein n=1 Tax=Paraperibacillus esterisolvens TaxID=3115296 RepID=UPI0039058A23
MRSSGFVKLAVNVLPPVAGGTLTGYLASRNTKEIYRNLKKPAFSPPSWVFPTVWTGLYTLMGAARYHVAAKQKQDPKSLAFYNIQLTLNFLWSFLFFKWGLRGFAFIEAAMLFTMVSLTGYKFYQEDKAAGLAMVPYALWAAFAMGLNFSVWKLNKQQG